MDRPPILPYARAAQTKKPANVLGFVGLLLGVLSLFTSVLAGVPGLVVCVMDLQRSRREPGRGRRLAIAGIVLSVVGILMLPLVWVPLYFRAKAGMEGVECMVRMRQLGIAFVMYSNDNKGYLPPDMTLLSQYLAGNAQMVQCPSRPAVAGGFAQVARNGTPFVYVYANAPVMVTRVRQPATAPLLYEATAVHHSGTNVNVVFVDGHVESITPAMLRRMLPKVTTGPVELEDVAK